MKWCNLSVGIIGATGSIGRELVMNLHEICHLHLAVRKKKKAEKLFHGINNIDSIKEINLVKQEDIISFCNSCQIVINCAGLNLCLDNIVSAVISTGVHYVDPSGYNAIYELFVQKNSKKSSIVLAAGMFPGLSGLLPRSLAENFNEIDHVTGYAGGIDCFSPAGAEEFIISLSDGFGQGGTSFRLGKVSQSPYSPFVLRELYGVPSFNAYPFMNSEFINVCNRLGIQNGDWFNIFFDTHVLDYISIIVMKSNEANHYNLVDGLIKASYLDAVGRTSFQLIAIEMKGKKQGNPCIMTSIIHAGSAAKLSAAISASVVMAIYKKNIPIGVHYAADILHPSKTIKNIQQWIPNYKYITFLQNEVKMEEGIL